MTAKKAPLTFNLGQVPATALPSSPVTPDDRKQVGARIKGATYRQLKARAALQGLQVQDLVEQAISEFLTNHPAP
jgi:hypothetical protein